MAGLHRPFAEPATRRLMVFGHPSHELALFGVLQRYRPRVLVLTDGGGPEREGFSRTAMEEIGLLQNCTYLGYSEDAFYEALLERDTELFQEVTARIREAVERLRPQQVFCDAIEFYNPVHDVTLPMVRAAVDGLGVEALYEVPLVYQAPGESPSYVIQRVPEALAERRIQVDLSAAELAAKFRARNDIYRNLHDQAGGDFLGLPREYLAREEIAVADDALPEPAATGREMRYEWRARLLRDHGRIERVITHRDHFLPVCEEILTAV